MTEQLASRAMIAYLSCSQWSARKLDRSATAEVTANHAAASDAGRFNKQTIPKEALYPIQKVVSAARNYFTDNTLPWSDNGDRALSSLHYFKVMEQLRLYRVEFEDAVHEFCTNYDQHRERARLRLNSLFDVNDYPVVSEVARKFSFVFGVMPLPTASDFRVTMADDEVDEVRQEIQAQLDVRANTMMADVWGQLKSHMAHLKERLDNGGRQHDSTLTNITDLLERLPGFNITNDAGLEAMRVEIKSSLQGLTMKDIRDDDQLRSATADKTADILKQMQGLMG